MPGYGPDARGLFEDDATKLYEEVCQKGQIAASDYRIAEDGELRGPSTCWSRWGCSSSTASRTAGRPRTPPASSPASSPR